ncbi:hypothetical protein GCM10025868_17670 [Angustibacter aerolatus]|uniref:Uncharacterized protein n=1 Tax=Angustibacter aerolatus TaxID=1162965 RepID=A0ABQ6JE95_9ACTN|nr:hypothetical protein GCM10025868_17670 [Angustibacter aerolatus]
MTAKSPFSRLDEVHVAEAELVAEERQPVLVRHRRALGQHRDARGVGRGGPGQQQPRLADQVEPGVGERDLLLELGAAGGPLREALREHQRVVAEHQAVRRERGAVDAVRQRGVDPGERVVEARPEGPAGVVLGLDETLVGAVVHRVAVHHMWGTSSGMS